MTAPKEKKLTVRISEDVHRLAKIQAAKTGKSLAGIVECLLRQWVNDDIQLKRDPGGR